MTATTHRMSLKGITGKLVPTKARLFEAGKLGLGALAFPLVYGFLRTQLLMRMSTQWFAAGTPVELGVRALSGVVLGGVIRGFLPSSLAASFADGMAASAVGSVMSELVSPMMNPAAALTQTAITQAEQTTGQTQVSGMNPMGRGLAGLRGLGHVGAGGDQLLFGVGTPSLQGASMFNGANVAIESKGSRLNGATVAIESPSFAGALM